MHRARAFPVLVALLLAGSIAPGYFDDPRLPAVQELEKEIAQRGGKIIPYLDPEAKQLASLEIQMATEPARFLKDLPGLLKPFPALTNLVVTVGELDEADIPAIHALVALPALNHLTIFARAKQDSLTDPPVPPAHPDICRVTFHRDPKRKVIVTCSFALGKEIGLRVKDIAPLVKPYQELEKISLTAARLAPDDLQLLLPLRQLPKLTRFRVTHSSLPPEAVARWRQAWPSTALTRFALLDEREVPGSSFKQLMETLQPAANDDAIRRLQIRRCHLAAELYSSNLVMYQAGRPEATTDLLLAAAGECLRSYLALNPSPKEKLVWIDRYREVLDAVEEMAERRARAGKILFGETIRVQLLVVDTDILLEQTRRAAGANPGQ
jgi:hypothetical protein